MKNFAWIICIVLIGFLARSIYKGNTKLSLAIFLCLLLAGAVWVIVQLIRKQKENTVAESLNRYHTMMTEAELINLEKANKDMDIEIAGLKVQLDVAQEKAGEQEQKIVGLEKKCREYEERDKQIKNTLPVILTGIFRKVMARIEQKKRWENITPALFEQLTFDHCPNALEQLMFIYRQGGFKHFEGGMEVKKEIIGYLEDAFYDLEEAQGEILREFIRKFNIEAWRHKFPSYSDETLDDMIPWEVWDEFLYFGLENYIQNSRVVSIAEKYGIDPNAVTDKNHGTMELIYPEGSVWVK